MAALLMLAQPYSWAEDLYDIKPYEISTRLMRSTFKIQGGNSVGTAFIVGEPSIAKPDMAYFVLFTAAHVLENIVEDTATIHFRRLIDNNFIRYPVKIRVRENGKPIWIRHPKVDVAAMRIGIPRDADIHIVTTNLFATDNTIKEFEIHPGDELFILGYPYGAESNEAGFPILRSGKIASYPLIPTDKTLTFLLDFAVFKGNSGGPVFLYSQNRFYGGGLHAGVVKMLLGIVTQEMSTKEKVESISELTIKEHKMGIAIIVHARYLKEVVDMLPPIEE